MLTYTYSLFHTLNNRRNMTSDILEIMRTNIKRENSTENIKDISTNFPRSKL